MNISSLKKDECCGCTACVSCCPTKAIEMQIDYEGFLYPVVDEIKCMDCGKCMKVCRDVKFYNEPQHIYACWSKDNALRAKSSSGGIFSLLAERILTRGGYVCAVGYSDDCTECLHKIISSLGELDDLRRAKFVQSKKYDVYIRLKSLLLEGKEVLFCGTPCEVGGLRQFLRKKYNNLVTCDIICGCVFSPGVYKTYIDFLNKKHNSRVVSVNFKDKRAGWRGKSIAVKFASGEEYLNSILDDDYCVSFHSRYNIRPSCFNCKYRNLKRGADFTLGDFWAIEKYYPEYDDNKGTSFVLTNTTKATIILDELDVIKHPMDIDYEEYSTKFNWCMHRNPTGMPEQDRKTFYDDLYSMPFDQMAMKDLEQIRQARKQKKLITKEVKYE